MPNIEQLELLKKSVSGFNLYRGKHPYIDIDLTGANLMGSILRGANLTGADLTGADLTEADLTEADLTSANLTKAILKNADLTDADLMGANFREADLREADLEGVNLIDANLKGAKLKRTKGIYSKIQEMGSAQNILKTLDIEENELYMGDWHKCNTAHCICGWEAYLNQISLAEASTHHPTLCRYYEDNDEEALGALHRVASGEESVWNKNKNKR